MTLKQNIQATIESVFSESKEELQKQAVDSIMKLINAPDGKEKWKLEIDFKTDPDWEPLQSACWSECPLSSLTKIGDVCHAMKWHTSNNGRGDICPMAKFAHKEKSR